MIDKLSFLKGGSDGGSVSADEERLMQLFQNRAGLKKAYADLKDEFHLLRDRLKQQEGATIRVQEQLDALGDLLADPRTGFGALVFFQLRGLWKTCHQQLSGFATDLTRQAGAARGGEAQVRVRSGQERAPRRRRSSDCRRRRTMRTCSAQHLSDAQERAAALDRILALLRAPPAARNRSTRCAKAWWSPMRRSAICMPSAAPSTTRRSRNFPASPWARGATSIWPSSATPRSLCEHVDAFGLAARAKEAVARRVHEMSFGTRADCEGYMQRVQKAQAAVANHKQITAGVRAKLERLRATCEYRNSADTVPTADSLAAGGRSGEGAPATPRAGTCSQKTIGTSTPCCCARRRRAPIRARPALTCRAARL